MILSLILQKHVCFFCRVHLWICIKFSVILLKITQLSKKKNQSADWSIVRFRVWWFIHWCHLCFSDSMLCYLDGGVINHDELVSWRHHLCIIGRSKNKSIDALKQHDALCKKYSTAGGADCSGQDFSIKPAVKNEWLWHLEAFSAAWTQPAIPTLPISQHFNSPSPLLVLACVLLLLLLLPPFVQRKSAQGLLHMLDEERKQVGMGGGQSRPRWEQRWQIQNACCKLCMNKSNQLAVNISHSESLRVN